VIPAELLNAELSDDACLDQLVTVAMRALGVATLADVTDYLRISRAQAQGALDRLDLARTAVEGWKDPAWLSPDHDVPVARRPATRGRFVGPFDNLVWYRARMKRLFDFEHTLEAYLPAAKREHGYYVCPLLAGTTLVGRADLAASGGVLRIVQLSFVREDDRTRKAFTSAVTEMAALVGAARVWAPDGTTGAHVLRAAEVAGALGEGLELTA
jgi:uncharacterized protein YcaQ